MCSWRRVADSKYGCARENWHTGRMVFPDEVGLWNTNDCLRGNFLILSISVWVRRGLGFGMAVDVEIGPSGILFLSILALLPINEVPAIDCSPP